MAITVQFTESQRQTILYALAHLAVERPSWDEALAEIAMLLDRSNHFGQPELFFDFKLQEIDPLWQLRPRNFMKSICKQ